MTETVRIYEGGTRHTVGRRIASLPDVTLPGIGTRWPVAITDAQKGMHVVLMHSLPPVRS